MQLTAGKIPDGKIPEVNIPTGKIPAGKIPGGKQARFKRVKCAQVECTAPHGERRTETIYASRTPILRTEANPFEIDCKDMPQRKL